MTKECCWTIHWGLEVEMINEKYKKKSPKSSCNNNNNNNSAGNCLEGIDQRSSAEQKSKLHLKKERKQCKLGLGAAWTSPLQCSLLYNSHLYSNNSFFWGREQNKTVLLIFLCSSTTQGIVSHLQIVFGSPASVIFWLWYHQDRKCKGRKMLMLV